MSSAQDPRDSVVLRILSGPNMGAEISLALGIYMLGSGEDCDIILHDSSLAQQHVRLEVELLPAVTPALRVFPTEGEVLVEGIAVPEGTYIPAMTPFFLGLTALAWAPQADTALSRVETRAGWQRLSAQIAYGQRESAPEGAANDALSSDRRADAADARAPSPAAVPPSVASGNNALPTKLLIRGQQCDMRSVLLAGILLFLLACLTLYWQQPDYADPKILAQVRKVLMDAEFTSLEVSAGDKGVVVSGVLESDAERGRLVKLAQTMQWPLYFRLSINTDISKALTDAFMVRGIFPQVSATGQQDKQGTKVWNVAAYIRDDQLEAQVFDAVYKDMPRVGADGSALPPIPLTRTIRTQAQVDAVLRPALSEAGLSQVRVEYLPGSLVFYGSLNAEQQGALDKAVAKAHKALQVPLVTRLDSPQTEAARKVQDILPPRAGQRAAGQNAAQGSELRPVAPPTTFRVVGVTMTPMRFITLESGERIFEGGELPGGYTLESVGMQELVLRKGEQKVNYKLRGV